MKRALLIATLFVAACNTPSDDDVVQPAPLPPPPQTTVVTPAELTPVQLGARVQAAKGCNACHSVDGSPLTGPTYKGLVTRLARSPLIGAGKAYPDVRAYLRAQIEQPSSVVTEGYPPVMPAYTGQLTPDELDGLIAYIESVD